VLEIPLSWITAVATCRSARGLQPHLQAALELEFGLVPVCLTALFSLRERSNEATRSLLYGLAMDRMLHVALIANILNATCSPPRFSPQKLARGYPLPLPHGATGVGLSLRKFSPDHFHGVLLASDQAPGRIPTKAAERRASTLGAFYRAIAAKFEEFGDLAFVGDPALQFVDAISYSERDLFRVSDAAAAVRALQLISGRRGVARKGTDDPEPVAPTRQPTAANEWPEALEFKPSAVINIVENSRAAMYAAGSPARALVDAFNAAYCDVVAALDATFNGRPERYEGAISNMYRLTSLARSIVAIEHRDGEFAAPSFEQA